MAVSTGSVHGQCPWAVSTSSVHRGSVHGQCPRAVSTRAVGWALDTSAALWRRTVLTGLTSLLPKRSCFSIKANTLQQRCKGKACRQLTLPHDLIRHLVREQRPCRWPLCHLCCSKMSTERKKVGGINKH